MKQILSKQISCHSVQKICSALAAAKRPSVASGPVASWTQLSNYWSQNGRRKVMASCGCWFKSSLLRNPCTQEYLNPVSILYIYIHSYINYLWNLDAFRTSHQGYEFRRVNPWCATVLKHWNTGFVDAEITWVGHKPTANHTASPPSQNGLRTVPRPSQRHSICSYLKPPMFEGSQAGDRTALDIPSTHEFSSGKKNLRSHKSSLNVVLCRSWRIFDIFGWTRSEQSIGKQRQTAHGTVPGAQTGTDFAWKVPGSKHWWHERPAVLWIATKNIWTSLPSSCLIHFVITQDKDVDV